MSDLPSLSSDSPSSDSSTRSVVRATVLLVDDDPDVLHWLALTLHSEPYDILMAGSASEAMAYLLRHHVDIVVSDDQMPGLRGCEFLAHVAQEWPHVGRIMLTGHPALETVIRCVNEGRISRFLVKPVAPHELRASISDILTSSAKMLACARVLDFAREQLETPSVATIREDLGRPSDVVPVRPRFGALSPEFVKTLSVREREVLAELLDGRRPTQIAKTLFVSHHTVRNHLKAIFRKLDVHSQEELLTKCRP